MPSTSEVEPSLFEVSESLVFFQNHISIFELFQGLGIPESRGFQAETMGIQGFEEFPFRKVLIETFSMKISQWGFLVKILKNSLQENPQRWSFVGERLCRGLLEDQREPQESETLAARDKYRHIEKWNSEREN